MHDLSLSNGHDNLGFNRERENQDTDTESRRTTVTNISNTPNGTPRHGTNSSKKAGRPKSAKTQHSRPSKLSNAKKCKKEITEETGFSKNATTKPDASKNEETWKYAKKKPPNGDSGISKNTAKQKSSNTDVNEAPKIRKSTTNGKPSKNDKNADKPASIKKKKIGDKKMNKDTNKSDQIENSSEIQTPSTNLAAEDKYNEKQNMHQPPASPLRSATGLHKKNVRYLLEQAAANAATDKDDEISFKQPPKEDLSEKKHDMKENVNSKKYDTNT